MMLSLFLVTAIVASTTVLGALPDTRVPLWIVNRETGQFLDDYMMLPDPGTPIITFPFVNVQNQRWILHREHGGNETSGNFTFKCVDPEVKIATTGELGAGLTAEDCPSVFTIVDMGDDGLGFILRITHGLYTLTGSRLRGGPVTLQEGNATEHLQEWRAFVISEI